MKKFKSFQGLKIAIIGDLKHSRVAKSNMKLLKNLGASLYFVSLKIIKSQSLVIMVNTLSLMRLLKILML